MMRQSLIRSPADNRRQSLLSNTHGVALPAASGGRGKGRNRFSEAAGKTAADCAAVSCCCPCTVMNVLVLAVYKVPAGLCRKASMRKQQRLLAKKRASALGSRPAAGAVDSADLDADYATEDLAADLLKNGDVDVGDHDAAGDLEKEMWDRFHGAGFWRSPSMRDT